jgi:hypothetical protein
MYVDQYNNKLFFGLIRQQGVDPLTNIYGFGESEYELYLINDTDKPVIIKQISSGGFKTYDNDVVMATPKNESVDISITPHNHVLYGYISEFTGITQYQAVIKINGDVMVLTFYLGNSAGFLGSLIPCLNMYGRIIYPDIKNLD